MLVWNTALQHESFTHCIWRICNYETFLYGSQTITLSYSLLILLLKPEPWLLVIVVSAVNTSLVGGATGVGLTCIFSDTACKLAFIR